MNQSGKTLKFIKNCIAIGWLLWSVPLFDEPQKHFDITTISSAGMEKRQASIHGFSVDPLPPVPEDTTITFANADIDRFADTSMDFLAPSASTRSALTLQAMLYNPIGASLTYNNVVASAFISTRSKAITTTFTGPASLPSSHGATASGAVAVLPTIQSIPGAINLATITTNHQTSATAIASNPFASKATTTSEATVGGIGIQSSSSCQPDTNPNTLLNLAWRIHHLDLKAKPTVAFAFMRDTVDVIQQVNNQISIDQIGFIVYVENGKTTRIPIDTTGNQSVQAWLEQNLRSTASGVRGTGAFNTPVVIMDPCDPQKSTVLSIRNVHTEASFEVPPRAVPRTGNQVGFTPNDPFPQANVHWDDASQILSFNPVPINILNEGTGNAISPEYGNDPLNGGMVAIDPLLRFTRFDDREYFAGNKLRLFDHNGNLLLQAGLPTVVFEDSLANLEGFELFGPIVNIEFAHKGVSRWLDSFLSQINFDSDLIPELFVDLLTNRISWEESFDTPARIILSFGSPFRQVPAPTTLLLFCAGLAMLRWQHKRSVGKRDVKAERN